MRDLTKGRWSVMKLLKGGAAAALFGLSVFASAQDWSTLQGSDSRAGINSLTTSSPGNALLSWFLPTTFSSTFFRQVMSPEVTITSATAPYAWTGYGPTQVTSEATNVFVPSPTNDPTEDNASGYTTYAGSGSAAVDYYWTESTPSSTNTNTPAAAASPSQRAEISWNVEPANVANRLSATYALYTWIPVGPTIPPLGTPPGTFQARYEVYTIQDSTGSVFSDVVDTFQSGTGWVRLGGGGGQTNKTFQYDGVNPIVVTLYNTVPRNALGVLEDTPGNLVYGDAIEAVPFTGSYSSSPIVSSFDPVLHTGTVHVVSALNQSQTVQSGFGALFTLGPADVGNGTSSGITVNSTALAGNYSFVFTSPTVATGTNPLGQAIASVTVGTPYSSAGLGFTISAGSTPFAPADTFSITVGSSSTVSQGVVMSTDTLGNSRWHWSPTELFSSTYVLNTTQTAQVVATAPWATTATVVGNKGATYQTSTVTNTLGSAASVTYSPGTNMPDGTYQVQMWVPGSGGGLSFAQAETVQIVEGTSTTTVTVNCDAIGGWVTLGTRRFTHSNATGNPLSVQVLNYSALVSDSTRTAFADAIQFVGAENLAITSTPVQATALVTPLGGGAPVSTAITLVAAEDGRIYCLDSTGNTHGGTFIYWAYPSLPSVSPDPNQAAGIDGPGPTAIMPSTFNLSSAAVETISGHPYLYVGSQDGRIYAIDVEGRGDTTTTRLWSYPDDYPADPAASTLGSISGSLAFVNDGLTPPAVIVPTSQGRLYSLDAAGVPANKTTFAHWTFPGNDLSVSGLATWNGVNEAAGDAAWAGPASAQILDGTYASASPDSGASGSGASQQLQGTAPTTLSGIPAGATIEGVQVNVYRYATTGTPAGSTPLYIRDNEVELIKGGTVLTAVNHADTTDNWPTSPASPVSQTYGGQTDLWGQTWASTDFGAEFGVSLRVSGNANSTSGDVPATANVDFIQVRVYYVAQQSLGPIVCTPTVAFGDIYFGTAQKPGDSSNQASGFFAVNQDTGIADTNWVANNPGNALGQFNGTNYWNLYSLLPSDTGNGTCSVITTTPATPPIPGTYLFTLTSATSATGLDPNGTALPVLTVGTPYSNNGLNFTITAGSAAFVAGDRFTIIVGTQLGNFVSGAVAIPAAELNTYGAGQLDSIVVMNDNKFLTSLVADGPTAGTVQWTTNYLGTGVVGNLSYAPITVPDNSGSGSFQAAPLVMVPTEDGRFDGMFALSDGVVNDGQQGGATQVFGAKNLKWNRQAWEYFATAPIVSSFAVGQNLLLGADQAGILYAFGNTAFGGAGPTPGGTTQTANGVGSSPKAIDFSETEMGFISQADYQAGLNGTITYDQLKTDALPSTRYYDWGETVYLAVFNFPFTEVTGSGPPTQAAPQVYFRTTGSQAPGSVAARQFPLSSGPFPPTLSGLGGSNDGYAVYAIPLGSGGISSLPPGPAAVTTSIVCYGIQPGIPISVQMTPGLGSNSANFGVANPLALVINPADMNHQIGDYALPNDPADTAHQVNYNGNPAIASTATDNVQNLLAPMGLLAHNTSQKLAIEAIDRSVLTLIRGPGVGIENFRIQRADLSWNFPVGGTPMDPIAANSRIPSFFAGFEDYPINSPNDSLDYPDIAADAVGIVSNPNSPQDPSVIDSALIPAVVPASPGSPPMRTLVPTEVDLTVDVPQFQPANDSQKNDSASTAQDAGYDGLYYAYVDTYGSPPNFSNPNSLQVPMRTFYVALGVEPDSHFFSTSTTVDLGSLPSGSGLPLDPLSFTPDAANYKGMFEPFNVSNDGNQNELTLQVARTATVAGSPQDITIGSTSATAYDWLDAVGHVVTDIDYTQGFSPLFPYDPSDFNQPYAILQKPRVGDRVPTTMSRNPIRRANGNLGVAQGPLLASPTPAPPRISMEIPFGAPAGTYSELMHITDSTTSLLDPSIPYSDPGFTLTYKVAETGLTGKLNPYGDVLIDNYVTPHDQYLFTNGEPAAYRDLQGNLHVAFDSTRGPNFVPSAGSPTAPSATRNDQLFVVSLAGQQPASTAFGQQLSDLYGFAQPAPTTGFYFSQDAAAYPSTSLTSLFQIPATGYTINGSVPARYNAPSFPEKPYNPFTGTPNANPYMAFLGGIQVQTGDGYVDDSKVFLTQATVSNSALSFTPGTFPVMLPDSLTQPTLITTSTKERPTLVQFDNNATVFYGASGAGHGQIYYATFENGAWAANTALPMPTIFGQVGAPSVSARPYNVNATPITDANGAAVQYLFDLAFPAKLEGASHADLFFGRIASDVNGQPIISSSTHQPGGFVDLPQVAGDTLVSEGKGVYQAAGLEWDTTQRIALVPNGIYRLGTGDTGNGLCSTVTSSSAAASGVYTFTFDSATTATGIGPHGAIAGLTLGTPYTGAGLSFTVSAGTVAFVIGDTFTITVLPELVDTGGPGVAATSYQVDQTSGIISADNTAIGGKVYLNPASGTVQFTGNAATANLSVSLTYTPRFLRVSSGNVTVEHPNVLYDTRVDSDTSYWTDVTTGSAPTILQPDDRYDFIYSAPSTGTGQAARVYMSAYRLGIVLPEAIATNADGTFAAPAPVVTGAKGDYQYDPAKGRIYFTDADEGNNGIQVSYTGVSSTGVVGAVASATYSVSLLAERSETAVPIDKPANEGQVTAFLDPFDFSNTTGPVNRPGLIWLFWTSTRNGGSDVFFETIAPNFTPITNTK
jgi:hypothetical protein